MEKGATQVLTLSRIFLHNWQKFSLTVIEVDGSLYLTGLNSTGKSTILDAMQVVLLADLKLIKFNSSVQDVSERTIDSFVRGDIRRTRFLRPGDCVGYIALEFTDTKTSSKKVLGCHIEAGPTIGPNGLRTYFLMRSALDIDVLMPLGEALSRSQLRQALESRRLGRTFSVVKEYQAVLLDELGGLNESFFDLFRRALSFKPITDIGAFVEQWVLDERPMDLTKFQLIIKRLDDLRNALRLVQEKIALLSQVVAAQEEYRAFMQRQVTFMVLHALLQEVHAHRHVETTLAQCSEVRLQVQQEEERLVSMEAELKQIEALRDERERRFYSLDVTKQLRALEEEIRQRNREADAIRIRWHGLRSDLISSAASLSPLQTSSLLQDDEQRNIGAWLARTEALPERGLLSADVASTLDHVIEVLNSAQKRVERRMYGIDTRLQEVQREAQEREQQIRRLREYGTSYKDEVEQVRRLLEPILGVRPPVLCELVEVPDQRWQNAVEAMLGERRFYIVVPPADFTDALHCLVEAQHHRQIYNVGVLNLARAIQERSRAHPRSLAVQVSTEHPELRAYLDSVLGGIITCESALELENYRRAVTADVMYYSEWALRAIPPRSYQIWYVGKRALRSQLEAHEQVLEALRKEYVELKVQQSQANEVTTLLSSWHQLSLLRQRLNDPLDDSELRAQLAVLTQQLASLDVSEASILEEEVKRLRTAIAQQEQEIRLLHGALGGLSTSLKDSERAMQMAEQAYRERVSEGEEVLKHYPEVEQAARELLTERVRQPDLSQAIAKVAATMQRYQTTMNDALRALQTLGDRYNVQYQFGGNATDLNDQRYAEKLGQLSTFDLPTVNSDIASAQRDAEEELREHIVHVLRENIYRAQRKLDQLSEALRPIPFQNERYRFRWFPAEDIQEFYNLVMDSQQLGTASLFNSLFSADHAETLERFFAALTYQGVNVAEQKLRERLADYRSYMTYDVEVQRGNERWVRLSKMMGTTSGGETQTPFYLAIAASFVQLYRILDEEKYRHSRATIRLAVFDEAFNRMDQHRIAMVLDLFHRFGLQVITATPLERCEYLAPRMCTSLVLTAISDERVMIEDYRNYAARLEELDGDH